MFKRGFGYHVDPLPGSVCWHRRDLVLQAVFLLFGSRKALPAPLLLRAVWQVRGLPFLVHIVQGRALLGFLWPCSAVPWALPPAPCARTKADSGQVRLIRQSALLESVEAVYTKQTAVPKKQESIFICLLLDFEGRAKVSIVCFFA